MFQPALDLCLDYLAYFRPYCEFHTVGITCISPDHIYFGGF